MLLAWLAVIAGLALLVWSADRFVDGASATARYAGMSPLLIGMVIVGFGTSAPELVVSAIAALDGNPGLALGNAYGSNITNIGLVVGLVAVLSPIQVHSRIITKELPILLAITVLSGWFLLDNQLTRVDATVLLIVFFVIMGWSIYQGSKGGDDIIGVEVTAELDSHPMSLKVALTWLVVGLILLVISSRLLVWGAVIIAQSLGVSDLIIGLTVVAIGTSLPELASSLAAIRKNEHDLALGNVIGSGLFNTLAVVGIAAGISPLATDPEVLTRDWIVMTGLTIALLVMGIGLKGRQGRINRIEGSLLLIVYALYTGYLVQLALT
ncbi:calcium/sodium antiporter [Saccharospirillum salsuginis]|uniref:Sodium:calcium antiporter n=1 Tax=Saccharospirillum salsuginis TaxID=418750 RepID=A0A918KQU4_9GAMM|nr:calcium/sodium antiporter [Saccharospirillum salsuginis]GGX73312.1 sodium:calcium antiporter [Saccharospirillum salsuginis]